MHIPRSDVAGRPERRVFLRSASRDDQIAIHGWRGTEAGPTGQTPKKVRRVQIDAAMIPKRRVRFSRFRIERIQAAAIGAKHDLWRSLGIARPILDATRRWSTGRHFEVPDLATGR